VISLILRTAARLLMPLMLLISLIVLMRGHNSPGGGFAGGLTAASAFALHAIAFSVPAARRALRVDPHKLVGAGLLLAAGSGMISLLQGLPFMTGQWIGAHLPGLGELKVGTPIVFDAGVYLVVLGGTLLIIFTLVEE
jgi:multicomponent Na+:H+ antiporter subunit B